MTRLALVLFVVACSEREPQPPAPATTVDRLLTRDRARPDAVRQRARALATARGVERRGDIEARIDKLAAELGEARGAVTRAKPAARLAARRHVDELSTQFDALLAEARAIGEAALAESVRIDTLPDRCFAKPSPDDCKLAPELLPAD